MSEWLCLTDCLGDGFTKWNYYLVDEDGCLIDDDGDARMSPDAYYGGCFKEIPIYLENV